MKKRIGSLLLSLALCLSLLPTTALAAEPEATHSHPVCGASCSHSGSTHSDITWTGVSSLTNDMTAGNYYLTADVTITSSWEPANGTFLCLNGHKITCNAGTESSDTSGVDVIKVTSGVTLTITDCQSTAGKITHTSGKYGRGVDVNSGTFNLYGGSITGNTPSSTAYGGGVYVNGNNGEFNMYGGEISKNASANYGGGVCVGRGSTFNMYGGKITANTKKEKGNYHLDGGGVYVDRSPATGDIPNKSGTFNMSGGEITGNNASNGGGVYVVSTGVFTVSGTAKVTGNVVGGTMQSNGSVSGGTASNVYLNTGKTITVSGALTGGEGSIGVTTKTTPATDSPVQFAVGKSGEGAYSLKSSDASVFTPDLGSGYSVALQSGALKLYYGDAPAHSHSWTYALDEDGDTITATCSNTEGCPNTNGGTLTINAPSDLTYDGSEKAATVSGSITGVTAPTIKYQVKNSDNSYGDETETAPKNAGDYKASITLGEGDGAATASVEYTIAKATPTADDFNLTTELTKDYTGSSISVTTPTRKTGKTGTGAITVKYNGSTTAPTNAGSYTVTFDVAEDDNHNAATGLSIGTLTINKATYTPADASGSAKPGASGTVDLTSYITATGGTATLGTVTDSNSLLQDSTQSVSGTTLNFAFKNTATSGQTATIKVNVAGCTNYNDYIITVTVTVSNKDNQAALTINSANSVTYGQTLTLSATGGSGTGDVTYAIVDGGDGEATIDGNTLTATKVGTVTVKATKAADDNYEAKDSNIITITITKATPTGTPKYTAITTSGKKLSDAAITTVDGTFSVAGSVKWIDNEGTELLDTTDVAANTAYKWLFTPTDSANYNTLTGSITLYSVSTVSTVSRSPIAVEQTENGSVTVSPKSVSAGTTVTITVTPDSGYTLENLTVRDRNGKAITVTGKDGKYTFTMPASKVTVQASFAEEAPAVERTFADVPADAYYAAAVAWAVENGITTGMNETDFGPDLSCTRAQIVTFLWRAAGCPEPKSASGFTDVSADDYYAKAVAWAVENGITDGVGNGKFDPNAACTRAQSVAFLYRAAGSPTVSGGAAFSDVSGAAYYAAAVAWAAQQGITGGIGGDLFGSDNDCTRAQIVTLLYRYFVK